MPDHALLEELLRVQLPAHLLETVLCHRSYAYEHRLASNERLEWLGDGALELYVTDVLYRVEPELSEAELSNLRAGLVSGVALASVAAEMGLGRWVRLGRGETATGGEEKPSILVVRDTHYSTWAAGSLHRPWFLARVRVGNWYVGGGEATTKKEAEQLAAAAACERLAGPAEVS